MKNVNVRYARDSHAARICIFALSSHLNPNYCLKYY